MISSLEPKRQVLLQFASCVVCCLLLLGLSATPTLAFSDPPGAGLPSPSQSAAFPNAFSKAASFPTVSNGVLISYVREISAPTAIVVDDISTRQSATTSFWIAEASSVSLIDAAVTADKQFLVLVGSYVPLAGGADVPFITTQNLTNGQVSLIKPAGDYVPVRVCAANNGTLWTVGQTEAELTHLQLTPQPEYQMVRSYSLEGTLLHSFVPRSSQGSAPLTLLPRARSYGYRLGNLTPAKLSCGDNSVGLFVGYPAYSWNEIDLKSNTVQHWRVPPSSMASITGLTLLGSHTVYASFSLRSDNKWVLTLHRLVLSPDYTGSWVKVEDKAGPDEKGFSVLLGRDGSSLVYLRGARTPSNATLYWSTP